MGKDDVVIINQPGNLEQRTSKTGKVRYVITMKTEPVIFNLDPKRMGAEVAKAIVHHLRERVKGIAQQAAPATLKARKVAAKAYALGKPWALRRYSGGRTGPKPPDESSQAFYDSGRFADSIVGSASSDGIWRVNVAANRLSDTDSGGASRIFARLVELVPEFGDTSLLLQNDIVRKSIEKATAGIVSKAKETSKSLVWEAFRATLELAEQVGDLIAG